MEKIKTLDLRENGDETKIESFVLSTKGYHLGSSDQWREKYVTDRDNIEKAAELNTPAINKGETFYRTSKLSLPREKMNVVNEKYETRTIRDIKKASWIITSSNYLSSLTNTMWDALHSSSSFIASLKAYTGKNGMSLDIENQLIEKLEAEECVLVLRNHYYHHGKNNLSNFYTRLDSEVEKSRGYQTYCPIANKKEWDFMLNNKNIIVTDVFINKLATEDSLIIDTKSYDGIVAMLKGNDKENYILAMEIMANCNVEESKGFLALLFFRFEEKFKEVNAWNHVNFKSIRTRFEQYALQYSRSHVSPYNQFIEQLIKEGGLTVYVMTAILDTVYDHVIKQSFGIDANCVFELTRSNLKLKEEYAKKCIDKNLGEVIKEENQLVNMNILPF